MNKSIRLSAKHGLNPTIPVCWFCGEDKNELVLAGAQGDSIARKMGIASGEMPRRCLIDQNPCDECQKLMAIGVMFVEATPDGGRGNGAMTVLKDEAVSKMVNDPALAAHILKARVALVSPSDWDTMGFPRENFDSRKEGQRHG